MSDTPRTDEREQMNGNVLCASANLNFARQLERELAAMTRHAERLEEAGGELNGRLGCTGCDDFTCPRCDDASAKWQKAKETKP